MATPLPPLPLPSLLPSQPTSSTCSSQWSAEAA
jgi:hypothetical protein